ncbi:MAG: TadG family pilus assembly protein [Kiloniellaceae bacterium]
MTRRGTNSRNFWRDERGSTLILFGVAFAGIMGFAALVIDVGYLYALDNKLQVTADSAALAGARRLPDASAAQTAALDYAAKNMPAAAHGTVLSASDVVSGNWDPATRTFNPAGTPVNAIQVTARRTQANGNGAGLFFARFLGFSEVDMVATAVAAIPAAPCVVVLDPAANEALEVETNVTLNCGVQVNSTDPGAIEVSGTSCLSATSIAVTGGYTGSCISPAPVTGAPAIPDPLAALPPPAYSGCDYTTTVNISSSTTLTPGVYCGGIKITGGNVTFQPGMYVLDGVGLQVSGNAVLTGSEVTFYLAPGTAGETGKSVHITGTAQATLSAPTSGPYEGILFYQDRAAPTTLKNYFKGGSDMVVTGALYFPTTKVEFSGNNNTTAGIWTSLIARKVEFEGNSFFAAGNFPGSFPANVASTALVD